MTARKLEKTEWRRFFDWVSKGLVGKRAEIEIASLALGDQIEAEWLPLLGITFDPKNDILEIALDGLDHLISRPREIYIDEAQEYYLASRSSTAMASRRLSSCASRCSCPPRPRRPLKERKVVRVRP
jgi:hypothetical protein